MDPNPHVADVAHRYESHALPEGARNEHERNGLVQNEGLRYAGERGDEARLRHVASEASIEEREGRP